MLILLNGSEISGERGGGEWWWQQRREEERCVEGERGEGSIRHSTDGWRGRRKGKWRVGREEKQSDGADLAERIIKHYYHNRSVIQLARA